MEFYDATNGPQWYDSPGNNWGSSVDHCDWSYVECDDEGRVVTIDIVDNNQSGVSEWRVIIGLKLVKIW